MNLTIREVKEVSLPLIWRQCNNSIEEWITKEAQFGIFLFSEISQDAKYMSQPRLGKALYSGCCDFPGCEHAAQDLKVVLMYFALSMAKKKSWAMQSTKTQQVHWTTVSDLYRSRFGRGFQHPWTTCLMSAPSSEGVTPRYRQQVHPFCKSRILRPISNQNLISQDAPSRTWEE